MKFHRHPPKYRWAHMLVGTVLICSFFLLFSPQAQEKKDPPPAAELAPVLNLDHADLGQIINIIGHDILKLNYIVDPSVKGVATINITGEFKKEDLFSLLETILQINGAAMVKTGNLYQIVPSGRAPKMPVKVRLQGQEGEVPKNEPMVMQVIPMRFVSSVDMSKILTPYLSDAGNMLVHEKGNILIVTDNRENMRKLLELVDIFDADVFQKRRVQLFEIKNHRAKSMVTDLESIFAAYSLSAKDSAIRFIPIEKINAILAVSPNPGSFGEVRNWIERLDQNVENMAIRTYVYKVENSKADHIAKLLSQIFTQKIDLIQPPSTTPTSSMLGQAEPPQSGAHASIAGFVQGDIRVVADEIYNMLIIQASPQDYKTIQETIRELDIVPRQVLIDAKIYEIQLSGAFSMGVQWFLQNRTTTARMQGKDAAFTATGAAYNGVTYPKGLSLSGIAWVGGATEVIAFLNAQETHGRSRVLSAPTIMASDNVMARIQVGSEVPMLSSQGVVPGGTGGGGSIFAGTVTNRSTGVILSVTPRINSSGWVTLKIQQEVSSPGEPVEGGLQTPQINVKSVDTQATVKDGETIVIGGIISESNDRSTNRVPIVGNIPILGYLFGNTTMSKKRNELIVMITPHVVLSLDDASAVSAEFKKKVQGLKRELRLLDILKPDSE